MLIYADADPDPQHCLPKGYFGKNILEADAILLTFCAYFILSYGTSTLYFHSFVTFAWVLHCGFIREAELKSAWTGAALICLWLKLVSVKESCVFS